MTQPTDLAAKPLRKNVRYPVVAGRFYPADPNQLRERVWAFMGGQEQDSLTTLLAMVPHAGYEYSGAVAGGTLGRSNLAETVVLLGPNHTGRGKPVAVWPGGEWHTPLGPVPVDAELAECLVGTDAVFAPDMAAHMAEHSLEVVLPFLQERRPGLRIVPIAVAVPSPEELARCGAALARCMARYSFMGRSVSLVVSSDMSHYVPQDEARRLDHMALAAIRALDPEALYSVVREQGITMCGVFPMTVAMVACRLLGARAAELTGYATSGDVSGETDRVVGYAGALVRAVPDDAAGE